MLEERKRKEKIEYYNNLGIRMNASLDYPASIKWSEIEEREREQQKIKELQEEEIRRKSEKRRSYAKVVRELHWPKISDKNKKELSERIMKLNIKHTRNGSKAMTSRKSNSIFSYSQTDPSITGPSESKHKMSKTPMKRYYRYRHKKSKQGRNNLISNNFTQRVGTTIEEKIEYKDYLKDMRIKREEESINSDNYYNPATDWRSLNKNTKYDERTKLDIIKEKSKNIDRKVYLKEHLLHNTGSPLDNANEVNRMLMDSIEAKLTILHTLNGE